MDKKIFIVAKREYLERVRSRWFLVITLAVPVLMAAAIIIPTYMATRGGASGSIRHIEIIDATGAGLGDRIAKSLMADKSLGSAPDSVAPRVQNVTAADVATKEAAAAENVKLPRHLTGYVVLDDSTLAGRSARYAGRDASSISDMDKLASIIREEVMMMRLEREGVRQDIVSNLARTRLKLDAERLTERGRSGSGFAGLAAGFGVGVMLMMLILIHGQNILRGVLEEKASRVAEVVISSIKPESLLAGKVLGVGAVGLTQQVAWLGLGAFLTNFMLPIVLKGASAGAAAAGAGAGVPANPLSSIFTAGTLIVVAVAFIYFIIGFVFYATLYAAAGSMVNSEQEAQQAAVPVMMLIMSAWVLVNPVLLAPNGKLAVVLSWLPWSSPIIMPMRMGLTSVSPVSVVGSIIVAILGSIGAMWLSARIYRVGMLMYGKKPTFAEMVKWVKYA